MTRLPAIMARGSNVDWLVREEAIDEHPCESSAERLEDLSEPVSDRRPGRGHMPTPRPPVIARTCSSIGPSDDLR